MSMTRRIPFHAQLRTLHNLVKRQLQGQTSTKLSSPLTVVITIMSTEVSINIVVAEARIVEVVGRASGAVFNMMPIDLFIRKAKQAASPMQRRYPKAGTAVLI